MQRSTAIDIKYTFYIIILMVKNSIYIAEKFASYFMYKILNHMINFSLTWA